MHSLLHFVRASVSLVSIHYLLGICDPIAIPQVLSPASVVFSGIGILLLVSTILDLSVPDIMTLLMTLAFF
jgi:hypothetical protein